MLTLLKEKRHLLINVPMDHRLFRFLVYFWMLKLLWQWHIHHTLHLLAATAVRLHIHDEMKQHSKEMYPLSILLGLPKELVCHTSVHMKHCSVVIVSYKVLHKHMGNHYYRLIYRLESAAFFTLNHLIVTIKMWWNNERCSSDNCKIRITLFVERGLLIFFYISRKWREISQS